MKLKAKKQSGPTSGGQSITGAPLAADNQMSALEPSTVMGPGAAPQQPQGPGMMPQSPMQPMGGAPNQMMPMAASGMPQQMPMAPGGGAMPPGGMPQQMPMAPGGGAMPPGGMPQQMPPGNAPSGPLPTGVEGPPQKKGTGQEKQNKKLKPFKYEVINSMNKKEKGAFDAESIEDVRSYLESQDYKIVSIAPKGAGDIEIGGPPKLSPEDLSFTLTQLATYIRAGIPLVDSVKILAKQSSKAAHKKIWGQVVYELLHGESFSIALARQGKVFPALLINMVKTSEMTGDLPSILDDMAEYYTSMNNTRKQMKSAMTYPIVILTLAGGVLVFMLVYLVPQFTSMFAANDATLPAITLAVLAASEFVQAYWIHMILGIVIFIVLFMQLMKKVQSFRTFIQTVLMHIPVVSKVIIYNEISNFAKTFASLINHGVFITDCVEILSKITNNEVYKKIINNTMNSLQKGDNVSTAFRGEWAIPVVAYEMIVTGENTGQLGLMMEKVARHFQNMHKAIIDQLKSLMEPFMMIMLAGIVAVILLSIVTPMFSMYSQIE